MNKDDWTNLTDSDFSSDGENDEAYKGEDPAPQERPEEPYFERRNNREYSNYSGSRGGYHRDRDRDHRGGGRGDYRRNNRPRKLESQPKDIILNYCREAGELDAYWLNLFNFSAEIPEAEIFEMFAPIPALEVFSNHGMRLTMDVKFATMEDLEKAIDLENGQTGHGFMIRSSKTIIPFYF